MRFTKIWFRIITCPTLWAILVANLSRVSLQLVTLGLFLAINGVMILELCKMGLWRLNTLKDSTNCTRLFSLMDLVLMWCSTQVFAVKWLHTVTLCLLLPTKMALLILLLTAMAMLFTMIAVKNLMIWMARIPNLTSEPTKSFNLKPNLEPWQQILTFTYKYSVILMELS